MALSLCPRCEQDHVLAATIKKTAQRIWVCPECEAAWLDETAIAAPGFIDLGTHLKAPGLTALWTELDVSEAR
jgi:transposase-like protein